MHVASILGLCCTKQIFSWTCICVNVKFQCTLRCFYIYGLHREFGIPIFPIESHRNGNGHGLWEWELLLHGNGRELKVDNCRKIPTHLSSLHSSYFNAIWTPFSTAVTVLEEIHISGHTLCKFSAVPLPAQQYEVVLWAWLVVWSTGPAENCK